MGLREVIEAAFGEAAAEGGVRVLSVDGDDDVWVAGLAGIDGSLEVRVGDRGSPLEVRGFDLDRDEKISIEWAWVQASRSHTSTCSTVNEARRPGIARVWERG